MGKPQRKSECPMYRERQEERGREPTSYPRDLWPLSGTDTLRKDEINAGADSWYNNLVIRTPIIIFWNVKSAHLLPRDLFQFWKAGFENFSPFPSLYEKRIVDGDARRTDRKANNRRTRKAFLMLQPFPFPFFLLRSWEKKKASKVQFL